MNEQLKSLPIAISKVNFVKLYFPMSERFLKDEINKIISENRRTNFKAFEKFSNEKIIKTKTIFRNELISFAKIYGLPNGYCFPENNEL